LIRLTLLTFALLLLVLGARVTAEEPAVVSALESAMSVADGCAATAVLQPSLDASLKSIARCRALSQPPEAGGAAESGAPSAAQWTLERDATLINKDVGDERWSITYRLADGRVTGNIFRSSGAPLFVQCRQVSSDGDTGMFDCYGADACAGVPCGTDQYELIASNISLPLSFFYPPGDGPEPPPAPSFGEGTQVVGVDVAAGTYRAVHDGGCYWERLSGFGGSLDEIIANDFITDAGPAVVTIKPGDAGFSSQRCGSWTSDLRPILADRTTFGSGTFIVGTDIDPGTYRTDGAAGCYWARLSGFGGTLNEINANDFVPDPVPSLVTIRASDRGFLSSRCGQWRKVG